MTTSVTMPSWGSNPVFYSRDYATAYIQGLKKTISRQRNMQGVSNHMDSYWLDGIKFYEDWIKVLDSSLALGDFEKKWTPVILRYANGKSN